MEVLLEKITEEDQKLAISSNSQMKLASKKIESMKGKSVKINIGDEVDVQIPKKAFKLLSEIISSMSKGKSISLLQQEQELSTQQAADLLHISRPHLVKLLEKGEIPFNKVGAHRRILMSDFINYQNQITHNRKENLNALAKQAQELNMGY